jgi:GT2 family glycosyltransferase
VDYCLRARAAGWRVRYEPGRALICHGDPAAPILSPASTHARYFEVRWPSLRRNDLAAWEGEFGAAAARTSVVVAVGDDSSALAECLASVYATRGRWDEVMVVDDAAPAATAALIRALASKPPRSRVIRHEQSWGLPAAFNVGARAACGDHIVLLAATARVSPGWLDALLTHAQAPDVGAVVARRSPLDEGEPWYLLPRRVLNQVGLLAEDMPLSHAYVQLAMRLRGRGLRWIEIETGTHHGLS